MFTDIVICFHYLKPTAAPSNGQTDGLIQRPRAMATSYEIIFYVFDFNPTVYMLSPRCPLRSISIILYILYKSNIM